MDDNQPKVIQVALFSAEGYDPFQVVLYDNGELFKCSIASERVSRERGGGWWRIHLPHELKS